MHVFQDAGMRAMDSLVPAVGQETAILPLLNGLRYIDAPQARLGDA